jgi:hypothetical protein
MSYIWILADGRAGYAAGPISVPTGWPEDTALKGSAALSPDGQDLAELAG